MRRFSQFLTLLLILFEFVLVYLRSVVGDLSMFWVDRWLWLALLVYLNLQFYETVRRYPTDMWGFFADNGLAFLTVVAAIGLFIIYKVDVVALRHWRQEEVDILLQCLLFSLSDFVWGVLFALRIAFAGKERGEFERHARGE